MVQLLTGMLDHQAGNAVGAGAGATDDGSPCRSGQRRENSLQAGEHALIHELCRIGHNAFSHKLLDQVGHCSVKAEEQNFLVHDTHSLFQ